MFFHDQAACWKFPDVSEDIVQRPADCDRWESTSCHHLAQRDPNVVCDPMGGIKPARPGRGFESMSVVPYFGFKIIPDSGCVWTIDTERCMQYLQSSMEFEAGAGGAGSNECVAWTVGLGSTALENTDWETSTDLRYVPGSEVGI